MIRISLDQLERRCRGRWIVAPTSGAAAAGVSIDSRETVRGRVFFAIRGDRRDGHEFVTDAANAGAATVVVERDLASADRPASTPVLLVENTRGALARLASAHREDLAARVVAITGSCGKTTTKEMVHHLLRARFAGTAAVKSFNNDLGVPLSVLAADPTDEYLVLEIGTNAPGEIASLGSIARPDIAIVTMVGRAHAEGLGSIEAITREKASLVGCLRPGGLAILHADSPGLLGAVAHDGPRVTFGESPGADLRLVSYEWREGVARARLADAFEFRLLRPGRHLARNALAAVAAARAFGMDDAAIAERLSGVSFPPMRFEITTIGGITVVNDAYNANPDSTLAALRTFGEVAGDATRAFVVLGEMLELGPETTPLHAEVLRTAADVLRRTPNGRLVLVGRAWRGALDEAADLAPRVDSLLDELTTDAASSLAVTVGPGDAVLIKGSRRVGLERLVKAIEAAVAPASDASEPAAVSSAPR